MDVIATKSLANGKVLELERRPGGYGVALYDPVKQDWDWCRPTHTGRIRAWIAFIFAAITHR